ncbi:MULTISPECIES: HAD-IA family hydrolase [Rhodomicrobium]|uniref:HAD-IA family hydrolase n=1 Tax=Rhodomicrobium TaxID=1068 RepID=UPI000B4AFB2D|nr:MULTISPECIES: HAD-IA family hydrolase [Rhodomicrobium]
MKLIIFDCDGTLIDSQHMIVEAMRAAFLASGFPAPDRDHVLRHVGLSVAEAMTAMVPAADAKAIARLSAEYRAAFNALRQEARLAEPMFPGAREGLLALGARDDVLLGIATGKSRRGVDRMIEREGFSGLFATIMTADDAPSKPHPAMILQAMEATGVGAAESVMVGDTSFDMLMARAARVEAIGVSWGYHEAAELVEAGAAAVARDFPELQTLLMPSRDDIAA